MNSHQAPAARQKAGYPGSGQTVRRAYPLQGAARWGLRSRVSTRTYRRWLSLRHTRITNAGGEFIGSLKRLESLDLNRTQITSLRFLSKLSEFKELQLTGTPISESELDSLAELTQLNRLLLQGTELPLRSRNQWYDRCTERTRLDYSKPQTQNRAKTTKW